MRGEQSQIFDLIIVGKERKARLEDGYHDAGYRSGWQVLSNSATAFAAAFVWNSAFAPGSIHTKITMFFGLNLQTMLRLDKPIEYDGSWCPMSTVVGGGWSRFLVLTALG